MLEESAQGKIYTIKYVNVLHPAGGNCVDVDDWQRDGHGSGLRDIAVCSVHGPVHARNESALTVVITSSRDQDIEFMVRLISVEHGCLRKQQ